ncbi:hypothetical protein [Sorangium sp. So ce1000]|uniref:hypothetical protein n=1 Tax=Sorangium sp. So ce1000 TaxID=3133325 RepID=UPI003F6025E0
MTADEAEAWSRIRFHLENQVGFWFALVVGDDPRPRRRLREQAEHWCHEQSKPFFLHAPSPSELAMLAVEFAGSVKPGIHWIRADGPGWFIEQWDGAASQLFLAMNERREAYRKRLDGGVIIEGRESLKRLLRDLSPDLFSIRAFIAEPGESVEERTPMVPEWRAPDWSSMEFFALAADPDRELERAAKLKGATSPDAKRARRKALRTASLGLVRAGRVEEAEHCVHTLIREQDDGAPGDIEKLDLNALRGMIALARGKPDVALHHLDDVLRVLNAEDGSVTANKLKKRESILAVRGAALQALRDSRSAEATLRERLGALEALTNIDPGDHERQLQAIVVRREIAALVWARGDHAAAQQMLHEGLEMVERKVEEQPTEARWRVELLEHHSELSVTLTARGDLSRAREVCGAALEIAQQLVDEDEDERWTAMLWRLLTQLSMIASAQGDSTAALEWARRSTASVPHLVKKRADDTLLRWHVAFGYGLQTEALLQRRDLDGAAAALLNAWRHARDLQLHPAEVQPACMLIRFHLQMGREQLAPYDDAQAAGKGGDARSSAIRRARQGAGFLKRAIWLVDRCVAAAPHDLGIRSLIDPAYKALVLLLTAQGMRRRACQIRRRRRKLRRQR